MSRGVFHGIGPILAFAWIATIQPVAWAADKATVVIDSGWHAPDTVYLRRNVKELEKRPFDGVATWISWPRQEAGRIWRGSGEPGDMYDLCWTVIWRRRWTPEMYEPAIEDLRNTRFSRFHSNFIHVTFAYNNEPMDWFDEEWWDAICHNIASVARVAKEGGCRGILIDPEQYGYALWNYRALAHDQKLGNPQLYKDRSFREVHDAAQARGQEFMRAINSQFENPIIFFFHAYGYLTWQAMDRGERPPDREVLRKFGLPLLAPFLDGMLGVSTDETVFVDGTSSMKRTTKRVQFETQRRYVKEEALKVTQVPEAYRKKVKLGFCFRLDAAKDLADRKKLGEFYYPAHPEKNHFTPERLTDALRLALEIGDGYVLFWHGAANWWLDGPDARPADGVQMNPASKWVPTVYWDALEQARTPEKR